MIIMPRERESACYADWPYRYREIQFYEDEHDNSKEKLISKYINREEINKKNRSIKNQKSKFDKILLS